LVETDPGSHHQSSRPSHAMVVVLIRPGTLEPFVLTLNKRVSLATLRSRIRKKLSLSCDFSLGYDWDGEPYALEDGAWIVGPLRPLPLAEHDSQITM
jgi:hypothetical protein